MKKSRSGTRLHARVTLPAPCAWVRAGDDRLSCLKRGRSRWRMSRVRTSTGRPSTRLPLTRPRILPRPALLLVGAIGVAVAQTAQPPAGGPRSEKSTEPTKPAEQNPSAQHTQQPEQNNPTGAQVAPGEPKSVPMPQ